MKKSLPIFALALKERRKTKLSQTTAFDFESSLNCRKVRKRGERKILMSSVSERLNLCLWLVFD
jgi:hypothetical protein